MRFAPRRPVMNLLRSLLRAVIVVLVVFHAWLLAERLASGAILEFGVALKWLWSAGLGALWLVVRRRLPLGRRSRTTLAFWLMVLLVHIGGTPVTPVGSLIANLPFAEIANQSAAFLLLALVLLTALAIRRAPTLSLRPRHLGAVFDPSGLRFWPVLFRRPPPFLSPSF